MARYSVLDARNNLSRLIADAESGIEVVITKRGVPVAQVVPIGPVDGTVNGPAVVDWIEATPMPAQAGRASAELDEWIAAERAGWE